MVTEINEPISELCQDARRSGRKAQRVAKVMAFERDFTNALIKSTSTERVLRRAKTGNTRMPTSNVVLNTIEFTARLEERVSQFITICKVTEAKITRKDRIHLKSRPSFHGYRRKQLTCETTKAANNDVLRNMVVISPPSKGLKLRGLRRIGENGG